MTDIYFRDFDASSPDGSLRLEVRGPAGPHRAFQPGFVMTLRSSYAPAPLWTLPVPDGFYATIAFVHESGCTVVRLHHDYLLVIDPGGRVVTRFALLERGRIDRHVRRTSVGGEWSGGSTWEFRVLDGRLCFAVTAWWCRSVIVDVATGELLPSERLEEEQRERVREELSRIAPGGDPLAGPSHAHLLTAFRAGLLGVREAVPWLERLAADERRYDYLMSQRCLYAVRQLARLSLRRLGVRPGGPPPITLYGGGGDGDGDGGGDGDGMGGPAWPAGYMPAPSSTLGDVLAAAGMPERLVMEPTNDTSRWSWDCDDGPASCSFTVVAPLYAAADTPIRSALREEPQWAAAVHPDGELLRTCASLVACGPHYRRAAVWNHDDR